jgi:hypothetical protein
LPARRTIAPEGSAAAAAVQVFPPATPPNGVIDGGRLRNSSRDARRPSLPPFCRYDTCLFQPRAAARPEAHGRLPFREVAHFDKVDIGGGRGQPGDFDAPVIAFAFPDRCLAARRNPGGIGAIADQLSVVLQVLRKGRGRLILLLHQQGAVHDDGQRHWRILLPKPVSSRRAGPSDAPPSRRLIARSRSVVRAETDPRFVSARALESWVAVRPLNFPFTISVHRSAGRTNAEISTMAEAWITHADIGTVGAIDDACGSDRR